MADDGSADSDVVSGGPFSSCHASGHALRAPPLTWHPNFPCAGCLCAFKREEEEEEEEGWRRLGACHALQRKEKEEEEEGEGGQRIGALQREEEEEEEGQGGG